MPAYRIMVVEHDDAIRQLLGELLIAEGYEVRFAPRLTTSVADIQQARPDMLIVELLPTATECTMLLLTELRRNPATGGIPVIVSSTSGRALRSLAAPLRQLGCSMLLKPFGLDHFLTQVQERLRADDRDYDAGIKERVVG